MDLTTYQTKARSTADPIAFTYPYLAPALLGEVGELAGHVAKGVWKGTAGTPEYNLGVALEYGDIAWMTAIILHNQGVHGRDAWGHPAPRMGITDGLGRIAAEASFLYRWWYSPQGNDNYMDGRYMWDLLVTHCQEITSYPFDQVLQMNVDKLASRKARGVLIGNGDYR